MFKSHSVLHALLLSHSRQDLLGPNFKIKISASEIRLPGNKYGVGLALLQWLLGTKYLNLKSALKFDQN